MKARFIAYFVYVDVVVVVVSLSVLSLKCHRYIQLRKQRV